MSAGDPVAGLVSTIIPVYNRPDLLREAVASVMAQTHRPIEIIIVDDGSTDSTPTVCAELEGLHPQVRVTRIANSGPGAAREAGRQLARGEFLQYLDSDDVIDSRKFETQVGALRAHPECDVAYCKTREYVIGRPEDVPSYRSDRPLDALLPALLSGRWGVTGTALFRRSLTDRVGPWSRLRQEEDWEYDVRVGALGARVFWCPEFLSDHRHHPGPRAGRDAARHPEKLRSRAEAHKLIYQHARRFGVTSGDPHMQRYARELFLLSRQAGAAGLATEARELFDLAREASGPARGAGLDFRLYRLLSGFLGWAFMGRASCWLDRLRAPTEA